MIEKKTQQKKGKSSSVDEKSLGTILKELREITEWFDEQEEVDVEAGLDKIKAGTKLVKEGKTKLKDLENEFEEVSKELGDD